MHGRDNLELASGTSDASNSLRPVSLVADCVTSVNTAHEFCARNRGTAEQYPR